MGLEKIISNLPKKRLDLYKNLVSVSVIITVVYAMFVIMQLGDPIRFFSTQAFTYVAITLIMLSFIWKLLSGGKIQVPNTGKKTSKSRQVHKKLDLSIPLGSWQCPKCGSFVIGTQCLNCWYKI